MRTIIRVLFALVLASCAGGVDLEEDAIIAEPILGTATQAIFMPTSYGIEENSAAQERCVPPWAGGQCWVPDNTGSNVNIKIYLDTNAAHGANPKCEPFFQTVIASAAATFVTRMQNLGLTASITTDSTQANTFIQCATNDHAFGHTQMAGSETHTTVNGTLVQSGTRRIFIDQDAIVATPCWATGDFNKASNFTKNATTHELYHVVGVGHEPQPGGGGITLMDPGYDGAANKAACTGVMFAKPADEANIDCYNATSGTGDRCAD
jgi:hypothetical protein